jgi:hypothetical protein
MYDSQQLTVETAKPNEGTTSIASPTYEQHSITTVQPAQPHINARNLHEGLVFSSGLEVLDPYSL